MNNYRRITILSLLLMLLIACSSPGRQNNIESNGDYEVETYPTDNAPQKEVTKAVLPSRAGTPQPTVLLYPNDLIYVGAFKLPDTNGSSNWEYSGQALTFNPAGDPNGSSDGFPGSLFGVGHDHQMDVSEISIPVPVNSRNLDDLKAAETLQPFNDISNGNINEDLILPVVGLEVIGDQLYFCYGQHMQEFEPSHGISSLNLQNPQTQGPWVLHGISNYTSNDYLFTIPANWAAAYTPGHTLATGRFREGVWSGLGPALYAIDPTDIQHTSAIPLLLYGEQLPNDAVIQSDETMQMNGYLLADHWMGGAWLTSGAKSSVIFTGTKAVGDSWYGFANGVEWAYDCAESNSCPDVPDYPYDNRGYWASDYQAQIIFYNPADLASVAMGQSASYQPQPYAVFDLTEYLFDPHVDITRYKVDQVGDIAYDRENGYLYLVERLTDEDKSVIHVWKLSE
jgi:hypothetical protein